MNAFEDELIKQAGSQLGVTEATGKNDGVAVEKYLASVGLGKGYAWCMAFVYWCAKQASAKVGINNPLLQTGGVAAEWRSARGVRTTVPRQGAQFFIIHGDGTGHTGIVTGVLQNGDFHTIEGNTNDAGQREGIKVMRRTRNVKDKDMQGFKVYGE